MDGTLAPSPLASALIESRARWRDFALLGADLMFETDAEGCFSFLAPDCVLGHGADSLLGTPAVALLAGAGPGPFGAERRQRGTKAWLRRADDSLACFDFTLMPHAGGLRGVARDITAEEHMGEVSARALRRATALGRLLRLGQQQGGAEAALGAMLSALPAALSCAGAALLVAEGESWRIAQATETPPPLRLLPPPGTPLPPGLMTLVGTESGTALLAWRTPGQPLLEADDRDLVTALALPMAALRVETLRQRELAQAAACDGLTGLLNRRGFTEGLSARLAPGAGALVFIDLDGLKTLNDQFGHEAGDAALRGMAARLRAAATDQDLAARLGGDEFCLWLHRADAEEAARRMAGIGTPGPLPDWPETGPEALRASLGIAVPEHGEAVADLMTRADAAMYVEKRRRGGDRRR